MVFDVQEVLINSNDRTSGTIGNFVIPLAHSHYISEHYTHVALSQMALRTHLYNINDQNNRLYFKYSRSLTTDLATITSQGIAYLQMPNSFYESSTFNTVVNSLTLVVPDTNHSALSGLGSITYTFNSDTKKSTLTYSPTNDNPTFSDYPNVWPDTTTSETCYIIQLASYADSLEFPDEFPKFENSLNNFIGLHSTNIDSIKVPSTDITLFHNTARNFSAFESEILPYSTTLFDIGKSLVLCSDMVQNQMMSSNAVLPGAMALIPFNETGEYIMYEVQYDHNYNIGNQVRHNIHFQIRTTDGYPVDFEGGQIEILLRFKKL